MTLSFPTADACHASTAVRPLITANGLVMPTRSQCEIIATAYHQAIADRRLQLPASLIRPVATTWLQAEVCKLQDLGVRTATTDQPVTLEEAMSALALHQTMPVSTVGNDPHTVWDAEQNLQFRAVHDVAHWVTGADDSFEGELAVLRHTLAAGKLPMVLQLFLASEIIGQAAYAIQFGTFPPQITASNILNLI